MKLNILQRLALGPSVRKEWYEVFASMTNEKTRMPVASALKTMAREFKLINNPLGPLVLILMHKMTGGSLPSKVQTSRLGDALKGLVPDAEATMIKAGEMQGDISKGLAQAAMLVGSLDELVMAFRKGMMLTWVYGIAVYALYCFMAIEAMPTLESMIPRDTWPSNAKKMGVITDNIILIGFAFAVGFIGIYASFKYAARNWIGRYRDVFDAKIWPFTTYRTLNSSSLLLGLSGFIQSGMPFDKAIGYMSETATSRYMREKYARIKRATQSGITDYNAVIASGLLPEAQLWIIRCYGETADFGEAIEDIAKNFVKLAVARAEKLAMLLNIVGMVIAAANLGWVGLTFSSIVKTVK